MSLDFRDVTRKMEQEKQDRINSLERQRSMWEKRRNELRKVGVAALDPAFIRRNIDKCNKEIEKIDKLLQG